MATNIQSQTIQVETQVYNEENGLSRYANSIYKDSRGIIWVGTQFGLYRFDGRDFMHFNESHGLPFRQVMQIFEDAEGWFWLYKGCGGKGPICIKDLAFFHPITKKAMTFEERFGKVGNLSPHQIEDIMQIGQTFYFTADLKLYTWTAKNGFSWKTISGIEKTPELFTKVNEQCFGAYIGDMRMGDLVYLALDTNGVAKQFNEPIIIPKECRFALHRIEKQVAEFDTLRIGRFQFSFWPNGKLQIDTLPFAMPLNDIQYEYCHDDALTYASDKGKLFHVKLGLVSDLPKYYPKADHQLSDTRDRLYTAWVKLDSPDHKEYPYRLYKVGGRINFFDPETLTAWEAGRDGIYKVRFKPQYFTHAHNMPGSHTLAHSALSIGNGRALLSFQHSLFHYSETKGMKLAAELDGSIISGFTSNPRPNDATLWGVKNSAMFKVDRKSLSYSEIDNPQLQGVHAILQEGQKLWLGNRDGLLFFDISSEQFSAFSQYNGFDELKSTVIYAFLETDSGHFLILTQDGLFRCSREKGILDRYGTAEEGNNYLPANNIRHATAAKEGGYWLASANGLIWWNPNFADGATKKSEWKQYSTESNPYINEALAAYEDDFGFVWVPTPHGLIQFEISTGRSRIYTQADGLSNSGMQNNSHERGPDGTLYFGSYVGFNIFHPRDFKDVELAPQIPLIIIDFEQHSDESDQIENRLTDILEKREIILHPGDKLFNVKVALSDYREAEHHQFAYKIEGFQEEWSEDKSNLIRISGLPYGQYTLKIRGRLHNGLLTNPMLEIPIRVLKPFYLQSWFFIAVLALFLLSVFLFYDWRTRRLKQQQKELETSVKNATETIRQQNEELKNLDKVKSRFFANVSHELRTPLTLILGPLASVLKGKRLGEKDNTMVELSRNNAKGLLRLVNEILDLTKMESGKISLQEEAVVFFPFMKRLVGSFDGVAQQKEILYVFNYHATQELQLLLDEKKVGKLINNLLSNAFKFTPQRGEIVVEVEEREERMLLKVQDSGRGIHPNDLPHVFDRFYQSSQPNVSKEGGTGIGLSLSMEFAKLMQGKLWAETELGVGSIFYFEFPKKVVFSRQSSDISLQSVEDDIKALEALPVNDKEVTSLPSDLPVIQPSSPILLVEDNDDLRQYMQFIVGEKYKVETAENGKVAWEQLTVHRPPSLIISDIMMPEMDGYQLLEKLKGSDQFRGIPVIMLTALADLKDKLKALRIGVDDYMTKPFKEEELMARIDNLLRHRQWRQQFRQELALEERQGQPSVDEEPITSSQLSKADLEWLEQLEQSTLSKIGNFSFSVEQLAQDVATSRRQLNRRIRQLTGLTAQSYVQEIRLNEARRLLEQEECSSVKALTYTIGAKDTRHFSRLFKKRFGKLPSDYL